MGIKASGLHRQNINMFQLRVPNNNPCISHMSDLQGKCWRVRPFRFKPCIVDNPLGKAIVGAHLLFPVWALDTKWQHYCLVLQPKNPLHSSPPSPYNVSVSTSVHNLHPRLNQSQRSVALALSWAGSVPTSDGSTFLLKAHADQVSATCHSA